MLVRCGFVVCMNNCSVLSGRKEIIPRVYAPSVMNYARVLYIESESWYATVHATTAQGTLSLGVL